MSLLVIGCAHRSRQTRRRCPGGSQPLAETLASLPRELERGGEGALRSGALRIGVVLFYEACLKSRSDFGGRLERLIDGLFPRDAVHYWRVSRAVGSASYRPLIRDVRRVWLHAQPGSEEAAFDKQGLVLDLLQAVPDDLDQVGEAGHGEVGQDAALEHGPDPFSWFAIVHAALGGRV